MSCNPDFFTDFKISSGILKHERTSFFSGISGAQPDNTRQNTRQGLYNDDREAECEITRTVSFLNLLSAAPSEINIDTTWKQSVAVYYSSTGLKETLQKPEELWCLEVAPHLCGHIWLKCVSAYENKLQLRSVKEGISMLTAAKTNRWWWKVFKSRATFYSCTTIAATKPWTQNLKMAAATAIFSPVCSGVYKHAILPGNIFCVCIFPATLAQNLLSWNWK